MSITRVVHAHPLAFLNQQALLGSIFSILIEKIGNYIGNKTKEFISSRAALHSFPRAGTPSSDIMTNYKGETTSLGGTTPTSPDVSSQRPSVEPRLLAIGTPILYDDTKKMPRSALVLNTIYLALNERQKLASKNKAPYVIVAPACVYDLLSFNGPSKLPRSTIDVSNEQAAEILRKIYVLKQYNQGSFSLSDSWEVEKYLQSLKSDELLLLQEYLGNQKSRRYYIDPQQQRVVSLDVDFDGAENVKIEIGIEHQTIISTNLIYSTRVGNLLENHYLSQGK